MTEFDAAGFWRKRLAKRPDLTGTGTSSLPLPWQRWLYRAKKRAWRGLLRRCGIDLRGKHLLNFGCGTGFFEDLWESWGAARADGIDIVPEAIERLKAAHPQRRYLCADLGHDSVSLDEYQGVDLVTAMDVLYHIVDEDALSPTLGKLIDLLPSGGYFLFTDSCIDHSPAPHVQFRSLDTWRGILEPLNVEILRTEPVYVCHNLPIRGARRFPFLTGAAQYYLDTFARRLAPGRANNWAVVARKR